MTREEAIIRFERQLKAAQVVLDSGFGSNPGESDRLYRERKEMAEIALAALRGPTREQVEKVWTRYRGGCAVCLGTKPIGYGRFKNRGYAIDYAVDLVRDHIFVPDCKIYIKFCPMCGRPITDEAVDIMLKRLEALKDETEAN